jgi:3-hydroxy-9,10-secoandrosta-1,3,5(10)-triene-9,17-dione monooxygenase reductase component
VIRRAGLLAGDAGQGSPAEAQAHFRRVLGHVPTCVAVVTAVHDGVPAGLTVGSFTSVSFTVDRTARSWPSIQGAGAFCVNLLADDQLDLCRVFSSRETAKFRGVPWRAAGSGAPIIEGVLAWVDCDVERVLGAGDHHLVIGRVRELDAERSVRPLVFFRGGYGSVESAEPAR